MVRIGIVGCGAHSEGHHAVSLARFVRENPRVAALVAACDVVRDRAERFCQAYGFEKAYDDLDDMLRDAAPDAVVSVVPPEGVAAIGRRLLEAGVACSIEKPPGVTRSEAEELVDVSLRTGTPHMVSVNRRFAPHLNRAIRWANEQGGIAFARGVMLRRRRSEPDFIVGTGLHTVDAMRHIGGEVGSAAVERREVGGHSWYVVRLEYESGAIGQIEILPTTGMNAERYELYGDDFAAHVTIPTGPRSDEGSIRCWKGNELVVDEAYSPDTPVSLACGAYDETTAWIEAVRSGEGFYPTLRDVYGSLKICFDCLESPAR